MKKSFKDMMKLIELKDWVVEKAIAWHGCKRLIEESVELDDAVAKLVKFQNKYEFNKKSGIKVKKGKV